MNKYCVYVHTNKVNGKKYVGITSQEPEKRWKQGYSCNEYFSRALIKRGWDGFNHDVIMSGLTKEQACQWEKALIAQYKTQNHDYGYNIQSGGEGCAEQNNIKVNQYSLDGKYIKTWASMKEADVVFGGTHYGGSQIGMACRGVCKSAYGYMWRYSTGDNSDIEPYKTNRYRPVAQYTLDGMLIKIWPSIKKASVSLDINSSSITHACKGFFETAGGYIWRYTKAKNPTQLNIDLCTKNKKVIQYSARGKLLHEYNSAQEASQITGIDSNYIHRVCNYDRKSAGGYIWKYADDKRNIVPLNSGIQIRQYDLDGFAIKDWNSITEAAYVLGIRHPTISSALRGSTKTAGGYQWRYVSANIDKLEKVEDRRILQYSLEGDFIKEWASVSEASKELKISDSLFARSFRGRTAGGYIWRKYALNYPKKIEGQKRGSKKEVLQFDINNNFIKKYSSISDASDHSGETRKHIANFCNGNTSYLKKYIWAWA